MRILLSANADVNAGDNSEGVRILYEAKIDPTLRQGQWDVKCDIHTRDINNIAQQKVALKT